MHQELLFLAFEKTRSEITIATRLNLVPVPPVRVVAVVATKSRGKLPLQSPAQKDRSGEEERRAKRYNPLV